MTRQGPTSVYLYFDQFEILIYVGVTSRGIARQHEHNADKDWWSRVARQEVEHFPNRAQALRRERELIELLSPPFNSIHNPDAGARAAYLALMTTGPSVAPEDKWLPMRVGLKSEELLVLLTHMEHARTVAKLSTQAKFVVRARNVKAKVVTVRRIGSTLAVALQVKGGPPCDGARFKYRHVSHDELEIKLLELSFVDGPTSAAKRSCSQGVD